MKRKCVAGWLMTAGVLCATGGAAVAAETAWKGAAGNGLWTDAGNWTNGVPSRLVSDRANFEVSPATGGSITLGTGSNFRPKNVDFRFLSGAHSYTLSGADFIDNQSNTRTFTTDAGMTADQAITSPIRIANHTITMNGSGDLSITRFYNENAWGDTSLNTGGWAINDANAVLTIGRFDQLRAYTITKTGSGTVVLGGVIDFPYGMNGTTFVSTKINVNAGTVDLSGATINLENHLDAGEVLASGTEYTLVNYATGALASNASFASTTGAPSGWEVFNNTTGKKIVLREIPAPPQAPRVTIIAVR